MDVTKMPDTTASSRHCACYISGSGGQEWLLRCRRWLAAEQCIQYEDTHAKVPMQPIIVTTPLELLHIDFTSIQTMMDLDQPPDIVNILVFYDNFTTDVMVYVTPDQTVKTVAKFLWQGYISIFWAPAKLLSDWGGNLESDIIRELCELMGIWKVRTLLTMFKPMDRWNKLTKCWCAW